jgi:hypothetical protein
VNDGEATVTRVVTDVDPEHHVASLTAEGGEAVLISLEAYELMPIWPEGAIFSSNFHRPTFHKEVPYEFHSSPMTNGSKIVKWLI